ncbi:HAD family phosphatase [Reinekea sp. G2M2-21]|uniref:HAD family hydrolase n=1 Tax=Reinekea sp. G2M2-21 TaxID=2788942 RepID=UPI0018ABD05E|nr:HAD-IB family phosphatase [Reinekea sp. G2M2-21]
MISQPSFQLASFDLDGTLVRGTSTGGFLAQKMGHAEAMLAAEQLYAEGKVANDYVSTLDGEYYRGYCKADIFALLADIPQIRHIGETVSALNQLGIPCVICTLAWEFVAEYFAERYGFMAWSGPALQVDTQGQFTGRIQSHFDETGKPVFIEQICQRFGFSMDRVFHVGDSRSDIELFKRAGYSVAINATPDAQANANCQLSTESLLDVLPLIPGLQLDR